MYRYSQQMRQNTTNLKARTRLLAVLLVLALLGCGYLGISYARVANYPDRTQQQLLARVRACCADAKTLAEKLSTSVQSNTASQLASIRQGIYAFFDRPTGVFAVFDLFRHFRFSPRCSIFTVPLC